MTTTTRIILTLGITLGMITACGQPRAPGGAQPENQVLSYLENAELQCEGDAQKANIIAALNDALTLPAAKLSDKKYKDYTGKEGEWNLQTLVERHFTPDKEGKSLGDKFYEEIKAPDAQKKLRSILDGLEKDGVN